MAFVYQSPKSVIEFYLPLQNGMPYLVFSVYTGTKTIQSYNFTTGVNDVRGSFSLSFFPETVGLMDSIEINSVVKIYERQGKIADFIGIVKSKRYSGQMGESGARRNVIISGYSIAALIADFKIDTDAQTAILTGGMANKENITKELASEISIAFANNKDPVHPISEIISLIWDAFVKNSMKYAGLSSLALLDWIKIWMCGKTAKDEITASDIFVFDNSTAKYPVVCTFFGQGVQSFWNIVENLIPSPFYEKIPFIDENGLVKIMIREAPFDTGTFADKSSSYESEKHFLRPKAAGLKNNWGNLNYYLLKPELLKSFDVYEDDAEVYDVFFSYLEGYPVQDDKLIALAKSGAFKELPDIAADTEKMAVYGYRPLFIHFRGYAAADKAEDTYTAGNLKDFNNRMRAWFGHLEKMYKGTITMSTPVNGTFPEAGIKLLFLEGEFYIDKVAHNWTYGGNPGISLSISRGADYYTVGDTWDDDATEPPPKKENKFPKLPVYGYKVNWGDKFGSIAAQYYNGDTAQAAFICRYNLAKLLKNPQRPVSIEAPMAGTKCGASTGGRAVNDPKGNLFPTIYGPGAVGWLPDGDTLDLVPPEDYQETPVAKKAHTTEFRELKNITKKSKLVRNVLPEEYREKG